MKNQLHLLWQAATPSLALAIVALLVLFLVVLSDRVGAGRKGSPRAAKAAKHSFRSADSGQRSCNQKPRKLAGLLRRQQRALSRRFGVEFSVEGEHVERQWTGGQNRGKMIRARSPRLAELYGIEAALYKSQPSHLNGKGTGLKFYFLTTNYNKNDIALAYFIAADKHGTPAVYINPGAFDGAPILEGRHRPGKIGIYSIEAVIIHELVHNSQLNSRKCTLRSIAAKSGWLRCKQPSPDRDYWILRGRNRTFYRYDLEHSAWISCTRQGRALTADGQTTEEIGKALQWDWRAVRKLALVKPATDYFTSPDEMFAEALTMFRLGNRQRKELLKQSQTMYHLVRNFDQREIDRVYGAGQFERTPAGELVRKR